ncbi:MAG: hypothetical protein RR806_08360 [Oscillospiraceae bacterium]
MNENRDLILANLIATTENLAINMEILKINTENNNKNKETNILLTEILETLKEMRL